MQACQENKEIKAAVHNTLTYFHLFRHPLYPEEIYRFLTVHVTIKALLCVLNEMVEEGTIFTRHNFYMLADSEALVEKRLEGGNRAEVLMKKAYASAFWIAKFPFVRSVCISGSLSKGYANEKSDIDLFIITQNKRLWICRTILHAFKKLTFLWRKEHAYCMNYFIDEARLHIEEENIFTATELATLIPVYNKQAYQELINENKCWLVNIFPNIKWSNDAPLAISEPANFRNLIEPLINILLPKQLNLVLMNLTNKWWRFKWKRKHYPMKEYDLAMKTRWYVSKNHPANYQKKIMKQIKENTGINQKAILQ